MRVRVELETMSDVSEFVAIASRVEEPVYLVGMISRLTRSLCLVRCIQWNGLKSGVNAPGTSIIGFISLLYKREEP